LGMSHHAGDVNCVLPGLDIISLSVDSATTLAHVINFQADLHRRATREQVLESLEALPRIAVGQGLRTTADVAEHYQDLGRSRRDWPEIYVWAEGLRVEGPTVYATISVHMESITIPETVDCIRAALGMQEDPWASILKTDRALGIAKGSQCYQQGDRKR
jgi:glyceraldehyde-3-phosphate dehydrogenase (NAD(P))